MKKLLLVTYIALCTAFAFAQETMYIMKTDGGIDQHLVSEVDSLIFYAPPPPAPVLVSSLSFNQSSVTMFAGETLDLSGYLNILPAEATDKTVAWSAPPASTVSVNSTTGIATAGLTAGSATITATTNDGSNLSASITVTVSLEAPNAYYQGFIPNAKYIGRWVRETANGVSVDRSYFHGAMIKVDFTGKNAWLNVISQGNTSFSVRIDGGNWEYFPSKNGRINLITTPLTTPDRHTLEIVAGIVGSTGFSGTIISTNLELDPGAETFPPTLNSKHIEFIGDSISTICYSDNRVDDHWNWKIAENLGWEHTHLGHPGGGSSNFISNYTKTFTSFGGSGAGANWDFSKYEPDAIVVNLGQNDGGSGYDTFLSVLRNQWPNTPIICLGLFTTNAASRAIEGHVNTRRSAGDSNIHFVGDAEGLITGNVHPTPIQSTTLANTLIPPIRAILGL